MESKSVYGAERFFSCTIQDDDDEAALLISSNRPGKDPEVIVFDRANAFALLKWLAPALEMLK